MNDKHESKISPNAEYFIIYFFVSKLKVIMNYSWDHKINRILNYIAIDDTSQGRCYPSLVRLDRLTSQNMVLINLYFDILRGSQ